MGKNYHNGIEDVVHVESFYEKMIEKHFKENDEKIKGDFKTKIRNLQNFYEDMNKKYHFQNLERSELHKKLRILNEENQKNKEKQSKDDNAFMMIGFFINFQQENL